MARRRAPTLHTHTQPRPQTPATTPTTTAGSSPSSSFAKAFPRAVYAADSSSNGNGAAHADGAAATSSARPPANDHKIGVLSLAALIFFSVSGGPYGMEEAIATAGPLVTMVSLVVLPLVWSVPEGPSSPHAPFKRQSKPDPKRVTGRSQPNQIDTTHTPPLPTTPKQRW